MRQRRHDFLAVADEDVARRALQAAVAQQRHQRRHEQEVALAALAHACASPRSATDGLASFSSGTSSRLVRGSRICRRAIATSRRAALRSPDRAGEPRQRALGQLAILVLAAAGEHRRRRRRDARVGVVEIRAHQIGLRLAAERGQGADGRRAHLGALVAEHPLDARAPLRGHLARRRRQRRQRPRPHLRRLVVEQQRRDQVALVERFEHVDGVADARLVGIGQLGDQRLDRRRVGGRQPQRLGLDVAAGEALAERVDVALLGPDGREDPQAADGQAGVADALPVEVQAPRRDQHAAPAAPPMPLAVRSTVTSTNGLACRFNWPGSGRNRISRVVLSTV